MQVYVDDGDGPGMVRASLGRISPIGDEPTAPGTVAVTIRHIPDNCLQTTVVDAQWPDGTTLQLDVASCLAWDGAGNAPARPALTTDEAIRVATDPRWGVTMDAALVEAGTTAFPQVPVFER